VLALPIRRQGQRLGVLYLENNLCSRVFGPDRVQLLQLLSSQIAVSLQLSRLFEGLTHQIDERKRAEAAGRFLADAGAALSSSLDDRATLNAVARLAVGFLADWCVVDVFEEGEARRVAAAHADPAKEILLHEMRARQDQRGAPVQALEMRLGNKPVLVTESVQSEMRRYVSDPETLRLVREIGVGPSMILPLRARERLLGTMTLVLSPGGRRYDQRDLALGEELARRAAMAIDNARLYREAKEAIRLRDDFISGASHELNTPIAALRLSVEGFERFARSASPEVLEQMLRLMSRQARRLGMVVKDLMSVADLQSRLGGERPRVDLAQVVRELGGALGAELDRARCTLAVRAPAPVEGPWERSRVDRIVNDLFVGAIRHGSKRLEVTVEATSAGIARLVFLEETHADAAADLDGTFGALRDIVGELGGTVAVNASAGAGSTFTIELPRTPEPPAITWPPAR
jgi:GAF domain-containing protein